MRLVDAVLLLVVAVDESLHVCNTTVAHRSPEYLQVGAGKVMVGIRIELALVFGRGEPLTGVPVVSGFVSVPVSPSMRARSPSTLRACGRTTGSPS